MLLAMSKRKRNVSDGLVEPAHSDPTPWAMPAKLAASVFIVWHLWAVLAEPIRFQTRGPVQPSPAADLLYQPVGPYAEFIYLTHGYAFFAPDPGPNHLIDAKSLSTDGSILAERRYPDRKLDRPRLYYHRHFMISEFYNNLYRPPLPKEVEIEPEVRQAILAERAMYDRVKQSIQTHLATLNNADRVVLTRIEHRMPGLPEFVRERVKLTDKRLYQDLIDDAVLGSPMLPASPFSPRAMPNYTIPGQTSIPLQPPASIPLQPIPATGSSVIESPPVEPVTVEPVTGEPVPLQGDRPESKKGGTP